MKEVLDSAKHDVERVLFVYSDVMSNFFEAVRATARRKLKKSMTSLFTLRLYSTPPTSLWFFNQELRILNIINSLFFNIPTVLHFFGICRNILKDITIWFKIKAKMIISKVFLVCNVNYRILTSQRTSNSIQIRSIRCKNKQFAVD